MNLRLALNLRYLVILGSIALVAAATGRASDATTESSYASWFRYGPEVTEDWRFVEVEADPFRVKILPMEKRPGRDRKKVMVLYPKPSSAYDVAITKILQVFSDKGIDAEFTVVNFEKDQVRGKSAVKLAESSGHDMIFSMGSSSTSWLWKNYRGGKVPVISVCSKDPVLLGQADGYDEGTDTNFAFTSLNMPIEGQMAYVLELRPNLKNLGVLVNSKNVSAMETQAKPIVKFARRNGIQAIQIAVEDPENARAELARKVKKAVATMRKSDPTLDKSLFWITGSTTVFREIAAINANSDRVPVLSVAPEVVKPGDDSAVLSIGISFESNAHLAAIYAERILSGRSKVGDLHVGIVSPPDIAINFRKAREIGLDIPFNLFESATYVYDYEGRTVRSTRKTVVPQS